MRSLAALPLLVLLSAAAPGPPRLALPLACKPGVDCQVQNHVDRDPGPGARDFRCGAQTYQAHSGTDIRLTDHAARLRGVDVLAAAPGRVVRLRDGEPDISVKDPAAPPVALFFAFLGGGLEHYKAAFCGAAFQLIYTRKC